MPSTRYMLAHFLANEAFKRGDFTLRSGETSEFYIDKIELFSKADLVRMAVDLLIQHMLTTDDAYLKHIVAPETGAAMFASAMQQRLLHEYKSELSVHVYRKDGTITGTRHPLGQYIIVEDIITSGTTMFNVLDALREHTHMPPQQIIGLIDRGGLGVQRLRERGIYTSTVLDWRELLDINGYYKSDPAQEPRQG